VIIILSSALSSAADEFLGVKVGGFVRRLPGRVFHETGGGIKERAADAALPGRFSV